MLNHQLLRDTSSADAESSLLSHGSNSANVKSSQLRLDSSFVDVQISLDLPMLNLVTLTLPMLSFHNYLMTLTLLLQNFHTHLVTLILLTLFLLL